MLLSLHVSMSMLCWCIRLLLGDRGVVWGESGSEKVAGGTGRACGDGH